MTRCSMDIAIGKVLLPVEQTTNTNDSNYPTTVEFLIGDN